MAGQAFRLDLRTTFAGPFFQRDPKATFRQNARTMMDALAEEAEKDVKAQIRGVSGRMPHYTGATYRRVVGRTKNLAGTRWAVSAVVSVNTAGMSRRDAIRHKASGASIERRFKAFQRTARALRASRAVISANLTKGIE